MKQTESQRLADDLGDFANEVELEYCVSDVPNTAALLLRQDELLKQALEALETCWSMAVGLTEAEWEQVKDALKSIRAHLEAK